MIDIKDKTILILGLGKSGEDTALFLLKKNVSVKVSEAQDSPDIRKKLGRLRAVGRVHAETGGHTRDFCRDADLIVASPGVHVKELCREGILSERVPVIGTLELGALYCDVPIVAITGTNGKSTVTKLIGHILSRAGKNAVVCGNIGNPLIGEIDNIGKDSILVVEVSSFQLETIKAFRPHIAVLLNIAEDHYDRHMDYGIYKEEKFKIFKNQKENDWAVMNSEFKEDEKLTQVKSRIVFFDRGNGILEKFSIDEKNMLLAGEHNLENIAASITVADILGIEKDLVKNAVENFKPLGHRIEKIGCFKGVEFIDDSKATNIDATRRAVETIKTPLILIAGGRDKGGDYGSLLPLFKQKVRTLIAIGEAKERIKNIFSKDINVLEAGDMKEAVKLAKTESKSGDTVMLSPMCSSFDMFSDYKARGKAFQKEVKK